MRDLTQLVSIVSRFKPSQINIIDDNKSDMANNLYQLILSDRQISNEEASQALYQSPPSSAFKKLKSRLRDKLHNTLFFIDLRGPKFSDYMKAGVECYRYLAVFFLLRRFGANDLANHLGNKIIKKSIYYDINEVSYLILSEMCLYYSSESFNEKKYLQNQALLQQEYIKIQNNYLMNSIYNNIFAKYAKSRSSHKKEIIDLIDKHLDQINTILEENDSFWLNRKGYLILTLYYQIKGELDNALLACDRALKFFRDDSKVRSNVTIVNFYVQQLSIFLSQKNFEKGWVVSQRAKSEIVYYNNDWHVLSYLQFLLCMHGKEYEKGLDLYLEVTQHSDYKKITPFFIESWSIFEAYVHLIKDITEREEELPKFSINRYVNNIPTFSKDKRGNNITILIAHFIFLLKLKKHNEAIDRVDALKMYAHRYLREDETLRSNCFIKMLLSVVRAEFNAIRAKRYAEKYIERLHSTPLTVSEQSTEIEIIPYEDLWDITISVLENQK
jgi:hypothetical protein